MKPKADRKKIAKLILENGLTQEQTSALTNVSRSRISEIMSEVKENPESLIFSENKDKVFEGLQARLVNLADDELLKTMLSKRGFTDVAILQDKIQLLRGQATEITAVQIRVLLDALPPPIPVQAVENSANNDSAIIDIM